MDRNQFLSFMGFLSKHTGDVLVRNEFKPNPLPIPPRLTKADLAKILGVSVGTVNRMVCRKQIPYIKLNGALVRFDLDDVLSWMEAQKVKGPAA